MKTSTSSARLKEAMEANSLRQADLIAKCRPYSRNNGAKIYSSILSQYLSGEREIGRDKLIVLAQALNVSEAWLAGYDAPMERNKDKTEEQAAALADAASDPELIEMLQKIQQLDAPDRKKVHGYVDAVYDLSLSRTTSEDD